MIPAEVVVFAVSLGGERYVAHAAEQAADGARLPRR